MTELSAENIEDCWANANMFLFDRDEWDALHGFLFMVGRFNAHIETAYRDIRAFQALGWVFTPEVEE